MIEKAYGASLRGKMHIQNKMPNQDAFVIANERHYTLAVVCDGLGSKKHSRVASKRLCILIKKQVKNSFKKKKLNPNDLIEKVQKRFKKVIWPFNFKNCDTTCLFTLVSNTNIMLFQLGDGLNVVNENGKIVKCFSEEKDFTNETHSFGNSKSSDWCFKSIKKNKDHVYKMLLCTDGISEDIINDTMAEFIDSIALDLTDEKANNKKIKNILANWPNKYSTDDKTMVVIK